MKMVSHLVFDADPFERTPNGPRTDPEQSPNGLRTDSDWAPNEPRTDSKWSLNDPERSLNGPNQMQAPFFTSSRRSRMYYITCNRVS